MAGEERGWGRGGGGVGGEGRRGTASRRRTDVDLTQMVTLRNMKRKLREKKKKKKKKRREGIKGEQQVGEELT